MNRRSVSRYAPGSSLLLRQLWFWFFAEFDDFEAQEIFPVFHRGFEERGSAVFHDMDIAIAVLCEPAIDVGQAFREHAAFLVKAFVNLRFAAGEEMFDDHVLFHSVRPMPTTAVLPRAMWLSRP